MHIKMFNILVVDDDPYVRDAIKLLLTGNGYLTDCAESGHRALEMMAEKEYGVVISDIVMKDMDGIKFLELVKEKYPFIPFIVTTGHASMNTAIDALRQGAFDYIRKPINNNKILLKIENALEVASLYHEKEKNCQEKEILLDQINQHNISLGRIVKERTESLNRSSKALEASEKKYSAIIKNSPDFIYILNPKGYFSFVGGAVESLLGFRYDELIGRHFTSVVFPEDTEKAKYHFNDRRSGSRSTKGLELRLVPKSREDKTFDVKYLCVELHAFGMYEPSVSKKDRIFNGTYGVARDISIHKQNEQKLMLFNEKLEKAYQEKQFLSGHLIGLLERERKQFAMDLHDDIGQIIACLKMDCEVALGKAKKIDKDLAKNITLIKDRTVNLMNDVENFSCWLRPSILDKLGLIPSLKSLFKDVKKRLDIKIHFYSSNVPKKLDEEKEVACFRIIQESLNNVIKHSLAKEVYVNLIKNKDTSSISLSVEDDGVGFELDKTGKRSRQKKQLGLLIMKERAFQLGGDFFVESRIGKGTHIYAEIQL